MFRNVFSREYRFCNTTKMTFWIMNGFILFMHQLFTPILQPFDSISDSSKDYFYRTPLHKFFVNLYLKRFIGRRFGEPVIHSDLNKLLFKFIIHNHSYWYIVIRWERNHICIPKRTVQSLKSNQCSIHPTKKNKILQSKI